MQLMKAGAVPAVAIGVLMLAVAAQGQPPPGVGNGGPPVVVPADKHDTSPALRDMPVIPPGRDHEGAAHPPLPIRGNPRAAAPQIDPALQASSPSAGLVASTSFDGITNLNGVLPPDTNGAVGPNHYVQWVNLSFAIYNKNGTVAQVPSDGRTLWAGFGGPCESRNDGDPIVLYDHAADRWILSQFALPSYPFGPFYQCIAISTTGDPTGGYYRYQYSFTKLNDYPKFGVWPNGYYMTINQFSSGSGRWAGQGVAAFDRARMLTGLSASMIYFDLYGTDKNLGGMLPSDWDGATAPPAGAPNTFIQVDDDAWGYSPDQLQIWEFAANWANPSSSTFTRRTTLPTAPFDSNMCNGARNCIPQPNTNVKVDALADRLMYRLQYRKFPTYDAWVVNHTVDVNGADRAGVRWYELRKTGSNAPVIQQQGTFSPDTDHRWMGSLAMDGAGNIALGYNVSSPNVVFPSIRFTARLAADPAGQMTQGDNDLYQGSGFQSHSSGRWGDYSTMNVDPVDDCTFWFTTEYYQAGSTSAGWRTRIGSFKLPGCGGGGGGTPTAPTGLSATAASATAINLQWTDASSDETGFKVERCANADCTSATEIVQTGANAVSYSDTGRTNGTAYWYRVRAFNGAGNSGYSNIAGATTPPAAPSGLTATAVSSSAVNLQWIDNSNETGFEIDRCGDSSCGNPATFQAAANATTYGDSELAAATTYWYRVRATGPGGSSGNSNTTSATTQSGPPPPPSGTMSVAALSGTSTTNGKNNWRATVTVTVRDNGGALVSGATVSGTWSAGGSSSCTTDAGGACAVSSPVVKNNVANVTFTVSGVSHATLTYDPSANTVSSVTVARP